MSSMADTSGRRTRRVFSDEFRAGAVRLVLDEGRTAGAVARDLDLTESALRNWVAQAKADRTKGRSGGLTTIEREELARLRKRRHAPRVVEAAPAGDNPDEWGAQHSGTPPLDLTPPRPPKRVCHCWPGLRA